MPRITPTPIDTALRAIADRATSAQERLRYRSARTLLSALAGWIEADSRVDGGPIALLLDRLNSVGHLPALPGLDARVARVLSLESQRTDEIASEILPDLGLSFELLRTLNTVELQGTQVPGNGTVLTLRRVLALIGVNGLRKTAAAMRPWPGPLRDDDVARLQTLMERVRLAGHVAQALRPPGYDPEVVFLITVMQNLGRLMVRYHFAEEAQQIDELMRPRAVTTGADRSLPEATAMSEDGAAQAVFGVDIPTFGFAVARHWGMNDDVLHMIRRLPTDHAVHTPDDDAEQLRILASAANEVVDVLTSVAAPWAARELQSVVERYTRVLAITAANLRDALQEAREALRRTSVAVPRQGQSADPDGSLAPSASP